MRHIACWLLLVVVGGSAQVRLAQSTRPWKGVYMHHPPYSTGHHGSTKRMRWPFAEWGADLVLSGHDHDYERVIVEGLPYIVCWAGGASLTSFSRGSRLSEASKDVRHDTHHGACFLYANQHRLLMRFISDSGVEIDQHELTR